jgi:hypothetical protein
MPLHIITVTASGDRLATSDRQMGRKIILMKRIILVAIAGLIASPVVACGPGQTGSTGVGEGNVKRHRHHENQGDNERHHEHAKRFIHEDNRGELLLESIDGGHGTYSKWSPAETKRRMEARAGHLIRKYHQGTLTNNEAVELQILMHSLMQ